MCNMPAISHHEHHALYLSLRNFTHSVYGQCTMLMETSLHCFFHDEIKLNRWRSNCVSVCRIRCAHRCDSPFVCTCCFRFASFRSIFDLLRSVCYLIMSKRLNDFLLWHGVGCTTICFVQDVIVKVETVILITSLLFGDNGWRIMQWSEHQRQCVD